MKSIFLDTNIYMHCFPADQIDWEEVVSDDEVEIVVPRVVIGELDKHKNGHPDIKLRHRARERAEQLKGWLLGSGGSVRAGTVIKSFRLSPTFDFQRHGLDRNKPDDELIASILEYQAENPGTEAILVTHDVGPQLTANDFGITAVELPEHYRLRAEIDPVEKENQQLRQKVQRLENALPELSLAFITDDGPRYWTEVKVTEVEPLTAREIGEHLARQKELYPPLPPPDLKRSASGTKPPAFARARKEPESYNRELNNYYQEYEEFLMAVQPFRVMEGLTVTLNFFMLNDGTKPGEDIDVHMHLPDGFTPFTKDTLPDRPKPPAPPSEWKADSDGSGMFNLSPSHKYLLRGPEPRPVQSAPPNVSGVSIKKTNSHNTENKVARVKHGTREKVARLFLLFDSFETASSFTIDYQLKVANVPEAVTGELNVKVTKEAKRGK